MTMTLERVLREPNKKCHCVHNEVMAYYMECINKRSGNRTDRETNRRRLNALPGWSRYDKCIKINKEIQDNLENRKNIVAHELTKIKYPII